MTRDEENYLAQYLPPTPSAAGAVDGFDMPTLRNRAINTNRAYAAVINGWASLTAILVLYLGLCLESTWAADYLTRSGRGQTARVLCYLELYPPAAALLFWCDVVLLFALMAASGNFGEPPLMLLLAPVGFGAVFVALAHAGVVRRWHPAIRAANYLVTIGLGALVLIWAFSG